MTRELDALVAEKVMGFDKHIVSKVDGLPYADVPHYSTSIADAWMVVEKMCQMADSGELDYEHGNFHIEYRGHWQDGEVWSAGFKYYDATSIWATADTAPEVICLAALKAVNG